MRCSMSLLTRAMIAPTVRHAILNNSPVAVFEVRAASHAAMSSKSRLWPTPWRAHPRDRDHGGPVLAASDWRRVGLDEHFRCARVQRPPPAPTIALVVARRPTLTSSAPAPGLRVWPHRHDNRSIDVVNCDPFDDRARQPARLLPYLGVQHPVCRPSSFEPSTARNLGIRRGAPADRPPTHPRTQQGPRMCGAAWPVLSDAP